MELRRSTRFPVDHPPVYQFEPSTSRPKSSLTRPKKKQKRSSVLSKPSVPRQDDYSKIKGKKGMLKTMTEMPLDILFEIFSHLQPIDLLHLSWTTKDIRAIVMDNNASFIWKKAFKNIPPQERPPPCPEHISLMRHTNVLYGKHCFLCASSPAKRVLWEAKMRICAKCTTKRLLHVKTPGLERDIVRICASENFYKHSKLCDGYYILKDEYHHHERKLREMKDETAKAEYRDAITQARIIPRDKRVRYFRLSYRSWRSHLKRNSSSERYKIRFNRELAIRAKLREEGYGYEFWSFVRHLPSVRKTAELTDRGWERMKPRLLEILEYRKQEQQKKDIQDLLTRRTQKVRDVLREHFATLTHPVIVPPFAHFMVSEPYCELIKSDVDQSNNKENMDAFILKVKELPISHIDDTMSSWKSEADNFLLGLISGKNEERTAHSQNPASQVDMEPLSLAMTFFKCNWCNEPLRYPRILMHKCLRDMTREVEEDEDEEQDEADDNNSDEEDDEDDEDDDDEESEPDKIITDTQQSKILESPIDAVWRRLPSWCGSTWNQEEIFVDEEASGFAKVIVQVCGEDPTEATFCRMQELNPRVECTRCSNATKRRGRLVMSWTMAILHDIEIHYQDPPSKTGWKLIVDEGDLAQVKAFESKQKREEVSTSLDVPFKTRPYPVKIN